MTKKSKLKILAAVLMMSSLWYGEAALGAELTPATNGNYVAIASSSVNEKDKKTIEGHVYNNRKITYTDSNGTQQARYYWVRDGYGIKADYEKRHNIARDGLRIDVYKLSNKADDRGLVSSGKNSLQDTSVATAINNDFLSKVSYGTYNAVTNSSATETHAGYHYIIQRDGKWVNVGTPVNEKDFRTVKYDPKAGFYQLNGKNIAFENVYHVGGRTGVFLTQENGNEAYTGPVYGSGNEILITAYDKSKDRWSSVWGGEITDPNATIEGMTARQFNDILTDIHNEDVKLADADVVGTKVTATGTDGGSINLLNKKGNDIPGFAIRSVQEHGKNTKIKLTEQKLNSDGSISSDDAKSIVLETGSRVEINKYSPDKGEDIRSITINGETWGLKEGKNRLVGGEVHYNDGEGTISIIGEDSAAKINGLKNTYTTKASLEGDRLKFSGTNGLAYDVDLTEFRNSVGKDNVWIATDKDGREIRVNSGDKLKYLAANNLLLDVNENDKSITIRTADNVAFKSVTTGGTNGVRISNAGVEYGGVTYIDGNGLNANGNKITNVAEGVAGTDAVNVDQLNKKFAESVAKGDTHVKTGEYNVDADNNVVLDVVGKDEKDKDVSKGSVTIKGIAKAADVGSVADIDAGIRNSDGSPTTVVNAVNNLNSKVGDLSYSNVKGSDIADGDNTTTAVGKLNNKITNIAETASAHSSVESADGNITVTGDERNSAGGINYKLKLNKSLNLGKVAVNGEEGSIKAEKLAAKNVEAEAVAAGRTAISDAGVKYDNKTYIDGNGLNANSNKVANVASGAVSADSTDAVNGSQLYETRQQIGQNNDNINSLNKSINKLDGRIDKVGASAAALAALHPLDFDPDDKLSFSAGMGNYRGENAAALGAFYRPDEKMMFSLGGIVGNGANMVNVGMSFALDRTNRVPNSRAAMAKEIIDLRAQVSELKALVGQISAKLESTYEK